MKVLVVSGFLGAGKTTFISEMARRSKRKFVVMENEMGAVGVDGDYLSASLGEGVEIYELTQGCICCSMKTDFATSVLTIESALQPDYLLVEPTGVGMLSRIMDNLSKIAYERIELLSPVTLLDSLNCRSQAREFPELFADQLASAGTVVFSKAENLPPEERAELEALARRHAPEAEIVAQPYGQQSAEWWETLWRKAQDGSLLKEEAPEADLGLAVASPVGARISSPAAMVALLEGLLRGRFGNVVRAKGTVQTSVGRLRFDVVGGQYCLSGAESDEGEAQAVFIGKALDKAALYKALSAKEAGHAQGFTLEAFAG
jgi:G3E family GTPase